MIACTEMIVQYGKIQPVDDSVEVEVGRVVGQLRDAPGRVVAGTRRHASAASIDLNAISETTQPLVTVKNEATIWMKCPLLRGRE